MTDTLLLSPRFVLITVNGSGCRSNLISGERDSVVVSYCAVNSKLRIVLIQRLPLCGNRALLHVEYKEMTLIGSHRHKI